MGGEGNEGEAKEEEPLDYRSSLEEDDAATAGTQTEVHRHSWV